MSKKFLFAGALALVLALALSGCSQRQDGLTRVRLNEVTHSVFYAPLYVAMNLACLKPRASTWYATGQGRTTS